MHASHPDLLPASLPSPTLLNNPSLPVPQTSAVLLWLLLPEQSKTEYMQVRMLAERYARLLALNSGFVSFDSSFPLRLLYLTLSLFLLSLKTHDWPPDKQFSTQCPLDQLPTHIS